ncbi:tetratricopeptide repeat protein [Polycladidibacter hongkongensis]|uniref:tetratricopeptide repeat protein n=1 Tax=Polycladidibacter hongkongensis TaxID=1647556 RepID=UPI00083104E6|nr:HrpB1 family type III secretion system apparatus protein [Pseudovibrio hongkongensis]
MQESDFSGEMVRTLAEIGFIAVSYGRSEQAQAIFEAFLVMRPESEAGLLGLSLVAMVKGDVDEALKLLEQAPPSDTIQTYKGLALLRKGEREQAEEILREICEHDKGSVCAVIAADALESAKELANPVSAMITRR